MSTIVGATNATAIECTFKNGSGQSAAITNGSDDPDWFGRPARKLLEGADAGFALSLLTEVPASTCYRYVRGDTQPSMHFYRRLLFGPQGATWHAVLMDGCQQSWWRELQAARDLCSKFKIEAR